MESCFSNSSTLAITFLVLVLILVLIIFPVWFQYSNMWRLLIKPMPRQTLLLDFVIVASHVNDSREFGIFCAVVTSADLSPWNLIKELFSQITPLLADGDQDNCIMLSSMRYKNRQKNLWLQNLNKHLTAKQGLSNPKFLNKCACFDLLITVFVISCSMRYVIWDDKWK